MEVQEFDCKRKIVTIRDATPEEITAMQAEQAKAEAYERACPPTTEERLSAMESAMLALMGGGSDV